MTKVFYFFIIWFFALPLQSKAGDSTFIVQNVFVCLNPLDCINCVGNLESLKPVKDDVVIYMPEKFKKSKDDIMKTYNLSEYSHKIVYSDSVYDLYSKNGYSTLNVLGSEVVYSNYLKDSYLTDFDFLLETKCNYTLPDYILLNTTKSKVFYYNAITKDWFQLKGNEIIDYTINDKLLEEIYVQKRKNDTFNLNLIKAKMLKNKVYNPTITAMDETNNHETVYLFQSLFLEKVEHNHDSFYNYFSGVYNNSNKQINLILTEELNKLDYNISPLSFAINQDKLYLLIVKSNSDFKDASKHKIFASFKLNRENNYELDKVYDFNLPQEQFDLGINNAYLSLIEDNGYVSYPMAERIFHLATNRAINIPYSEPMLHKNKDIMSQQVTGYIILDISIDESKAIARILYQNGSKVQLITFNPNNSKFISNITILDSQTPDQHQFQAMAFAPDGHSILIKYEDLPCLETIYLN